VTYEAECDPETNSCFVRCDDDDCFETYNYSLITRKANKIKKLCGENITDCNSALSCKIDEINCSIEYCNAASGECSLPDTEQDDIDTISVLEKF